MGFVRDLRSNLDRFVRFRSGDGAVDLVQLSMATSLNCDTHLPLILPRVKPDPFKS